MPALRDVRSLSRAQLRKELVDLGKQFAKMRSGDDELGGGSPGEWMDERCDEIRTELRRLRNTRVMKNLTNPKLRAAR